MKLALFADIHANLEALSACLADAKRLGAQSYVFLGDLVGYGADPHAVIDLVQRHVADGALAVRGNHDEAALGGLCADMSFVAREAAVWTRAQLTQAERDFLASLPLTAQAHGCQFVHASADRPEAWKYVVTAAAAVRCLKAAAAPVVFAGHVHHPLLFHSTRDGAAVFVPRGSMPISLSSGRRWLVMSGAVGQPRDGNPAAAYLLYDTAARELRFLRVPYDWMTAAAKIRAAGLPESLAARLAHGQ